MENNKLTNVQKRIASIMLANDNIDEYEISDVIISFGYLLKKENIDTVKELIVRYSDEIHSRLNDYLYEKDDIIEDIYCLVDSIKSIKNKSDKGSEERKIIREELNKEKSNVKISILCPGPVKTNFLSVANVKFNIRQANSYKVAKYAIDHLNRFYIVPGIDIKFAKLGAKIFPSSLVAKVTYMIQKKKLQ